MPRGTKSLKNFPQKLKLAHGSRRSRKGEIRHAAGQGARHHQIATKNGDLRRRSWLTGRLLLLVPDSYAAA